MPKSQLSPDEIRVAARNRIGTGPFVLVTFNQGTPYVLTEGMTRALWNTAITRVIYYVEKAAGLNHEIKLALREGEQNEGLKLDQETPESLGK